SPMAPPAAGPVHDGTPLHPVVDVPIVPRPAQNNLSVVAINAQNRCFRVLRLSPGPTAPPAPFDIILPSAAAFCDGVNGPQASYPTFTPATCGWHAIFERVTEPALLRDCWGPGNLGEYPNVLALWKSWDEGAMIEGVGQRPSLQLVDARWGCHQDTRSKKGHLPAWRPRNDGNARKRWSQYQFFVRCIEASVANGRTALQTIRELEDLRGSRTLPQLHCELQLKGRRK
ncbi:hypothetical protein BJY52DRAFT_1092766, partial [Lactarius psammicola]